MQPGPGLSLPDFGLDLGPELEAGMAEHRAEIEAIAAGPWPPTFADTIEALERAGGRLHLAERLFADTSGARSTPAVRALEAEMLPRLAAHRDAVGLDPRLLARIADLVARRDELELEAEQACVLDCYHRDIVRAGATLGPADQARLREVNERLAALTAQFRRNLHEETAALAVRVETAAELDGLPQSMIDAAARAAGHDGFVLTLSLPRRSPPSSTCTTAPSASASGERRSPGDGAAANTTTGPRSPRSPPCERSAPACSASARTRST